MSEESPTIISQDEGRVLHAFGQELIILLDGERTNGRLTAFINVNPPGDGPPPHYHATEDETFYVLEGRVAFLANGEWREAGPGASAFMPRGSVHTFKNVGEQPLRLLIVTVPAGLDKYFCRCDEEFAKPGGPDMSRVLQISEEHGIHFLQD
jgi:quercetin dioxygenase-like cupin family protein